MKSTKGWRIGKLIITIVDNISISFIINSYIFQSNWTALISSISSSNPLSLIFDYFLIAITFSLIVWFAVYIAYSSEKCNPLLLQWDLFNIK